MATPNKHLLEYFDAPINHIVTVLIRHPKYSSPVTSTKNIYPDLKGEKLPSITTSHSGVVPLLLS